MQTDEERRGERERKKAIMAAAIADLQRALNTAPVNHSSWTYQRAVEYKEAMKKGQKIAKAQEPKLDQVLEITRTICKFLG